MRLKGWLWKQGLLFLIRDIYSLYYGTIIKFRKDDYMMWFGIALVLIGVFLIGKSSN